MSATSSGSSLPTIRIMEPNGASRGQFPLGPAGLTIGRAPDNSVVIDNAAVAPHHLRVDWDGEQVTVTDLGSDGGTILGNLVLPPGQPHAWSPATWLSVGPYWLRFDHPGVPDQSGTMETLPPVAAGHRPGRTLLGTLLEYGLFALLIFTAVFLIGDRGTVSAADLVASPGNDSASRGADDGEAAPTATTAATLTAVAQAEIPTATVWLPTVTATLEPPPTNPPTATPLPTPTPIPTATVPIGAPTSTPIPTATPPYTATPPPPPPSGVEGSALQSVDIPPDATGLLVVQYAISVLGHPYVWGGEVIDNALRGTDCSGLVWWAHNQAGVAWAVNETRTTAADQYDRLATHIPADQKAAGDAVFYSINSRLDHVALYTGNGEIIHAPKPGDNVKFAQWDLWNPSWVAGVGRMY